jgi:hypothetical protein
MTAFNVVRFRVKPGRDREFIDVHRNAQVAFKGWRNGALVKTGDQTYCLVAEWDRFDDIVAARPRMIDMLDSFRELLEDLGNGLGVTDPVSGETVAELGNRAGGRARPKKKAAARAARKPAKKKAAKKKTAKRGRKSAGRRLD